MSTSNQHCRVLENLCSVLAYSVIAPSSHQIDIAQTTGCHLVAKLKEVEFGELRSSSIGCVGLAERWIGLAA